MGTHSSRRCVVMNEYGGMDNGCRSHGRLRDGTHPVLLCLFYPLRSGSDQRKARVGAGRVGRRLETLIPGVYRE